MAKYTVYARPFRYGINTKADRVRDDRKSKRTRKTVKTSRSYQVEEKNYVRYQDDERDLIYQWNWELQYVFWTS